VGSSWSGAKKDRQSNPNKHLIGEEPRYLIRTLVQNLRVGAVRTTILSALARAVVLSPPRSATISIPAESEVFTLDEEVLVVVRSAQESIKREEESGSTTTSPRKAKQKKSEALEDAEKRIQATLKHSDAVLRKVFAQHPSFDDIVPVLMERGIGGIAESVKLTLGIPLLPTLGSPMRALDDIYARLGPNAQWTAEMKYDGQRAQVHAWRRNGTVDIKIFSRHLEDMTDKVGRRAILTASSEP
jgi:DNA ligase-1